MMCSNNVPEEASAAVPPLKEGQLQCKLSV